MLQVLLIQDFKIILYLFLFYHIKIVLILIFENYYVLSKDYTSDRFPYMSTTPVYT